MEFLKWFIDIILHLDKHLALIVTNYGVWTYGIIFLIIFCETGLIVAPFLPGDSLLFGVGAVAATTGALDVNLLFILITVAAIIGDFVNYTVGKTSGEKILSKPNRFIKRENIDKTTAFYQKHGGKTIILARFIPIVRTFAPFVAGLAKMDSSKFLIYNVVGAIIWSGSLVYLGYIFADNPLVKKNFSLVVFGVIIISVLPIAIEIIRGIFSKKENLS
jgi:membrane-associated protein